MKTPRTRREAVVRPLGGAAPFGACWEDCSGRPSRRPNAQGRAPPFISRGGAARSGLKAKATRSLERRSPTGRSVPRGARRLGRARRRGGRRPPARPGFWPVRCLLRQAGPLRFSSLRRSERSCDRALGAVKRGPVGVYSDGLVCGPRMRGRQAHHDHDAGVNHSQLLPCGNFRAGARRRRARPGWAVLRLGH